MRANGFSIIECAFALVLLSAGLLSVAVTARSANQLAARSRLTSDAVQLALSRAALLESAGCQAAGGSVRSGRYDETWSVQPSPGLRRWSIAIATSHLGRPLTWRFDGAVLCRAELP